MIFDAFPRRVLALLTVNTVFHFMNKVGPLCIYFIYYSQRDSYLWKVHCHQKAQKTFLTYSHIIFPGREPRQMYTTFETTLRN